MEKVNYGSVHYYSAGVLLLLITIIIYVVNKYSYWTRRAVVQARPVPILGNFAKYVCFKKSQSDIAEDIYNKYSFVPYVGIYLFTRPTLVLRDPEIIKCIMTKDFINFTSRGLNVDRRDRFANHLFFSDGKYWKIWRQNLSPCFSTLKMKNMTYLMVECSRRLSSYLGSTAMKNKEVDIRKITSDFMLEVIGACAFGLQTNSMNEDFNSFREISELVFKTSTFRSIIEFLRFSFPSLYYALNLKSSNPSIDKFITRIFTDVSNSRKGESAIRHDLIDLLMDVRSRGFLEGDTFDSSEGKKRLAIDDVDLASQCFAFFTGGFETSSTTMSFALYELAKNRNIQTKLRDEITEKLKQTNGEITFELITQLTYLDMVVDEVLRMYPVLGVLDRECISDYKMPDSDVILKKGTHIFIPVKALQLDPRYYDNPDEFNPDNFLPEVKASRHPYVYLPFGEGPRNCIGLRFGKLQVKIGLITVLEKYDFFPSKNTQNKITFNPQNLIMEPIGGIHLDVIPLKVQ